MADQTTVSSGSYISDLAGALLLAQAPADEIGYSGAVDMPRDASWVKQSFLVTVDDNGKPFLSADADYARSLSPAILKYTDSSIGGNVCINPPPQFTRYADIRVPGVNYQSPVSATSLKSLRELGKNQYVNVPLAQVTSYGMGRYYDEAIDENSQIIHIRYGTPSFNSLTQFFTGFYDSGMATAARTGRLSDSFINRFMGSVGTTIGLAIAPLFIVPMAFILIAKTARFLANAPASKFYYLKPAMPLYWSSVTNMVNQIAVNAGLINAIDTRQSAAVMKGYEDPAFAGSGVIGQMGVIAHYLPKDVLSEDGKFIDVKKIACRAKIMEQRFYEIMSRAVDSADQNTAFEDVMLKAMKMLREELNTRIDHGGLEDYLYRHYKFSEYGKADDVPSTAEDTSGGTANSSTKNNGSDETDFRAKYARKEDNTLSDDMKSYLSKVGDYFTANLADGSEWVSYRVDYTGATQESFSNSVTESALASKLNSIATNSRNVRFNLADGNLIPGMGEVKDAFMNLVGGVADTLSIDGIFALAGSAFVEIPKHWDSSSVSLPRANYTMTLISPYGNPVSQLLHIWIPLSMLMCGALPLATGAQSHTSPFLCELHDRGRTMTRLGIIDNLSISRGTSHLGFNSSGHALAVEVSFSVLDLSNIMAVPITPGFDGLNPFKGIADADNSYSDYLMSLAGMQLPDVVYRFPMLKYQINKKIADYKAMLSPANVGQSLATLPGVNLLSAFMRGTSMK